MRKPTKRSCHIIDLTQIAYATFGVGVAKYNPRKCLACGQPIKRGESWRRDASAADPDGHGRVVTVRHSPRCLSGKARRNSEDADEAVMRQIDSLVSARPTVSGRRTRPRSDAAHNDKRRPRP